MKDKYEKVSVQRDDSGHWYVIPADKLGAFQNYMNTLEYDSDYELVNNFEKEFSQYRTGGSINLVQLYRKID